MEFLSACAIIVTFNCIQGISSDHDGVAGLTAAVAENKAALVNTVAQEYGRKAAFNELQSKVFKSKAEKFKYYAEQFSKRAELFQNRAQHHRKLSEQSQSTAQVHEEKSAEFMSKARTSREKATELEAIKSEYLNRARGEFNNYAISQSQAHVALTRTRAYENEAKNYFTWGSNLKRRSEEVKKESDIQYRHGTEAKKRAEKEKLIYQEHEKLAQSHLNKARGYETKASEIALKIKDAFRIYEDFIMNAANEHNIGREKRVKATDEVVVAKVYDQAAMDMNTVLQVQQGEFSELMSNAKSADKAAQVYRAAATDVLKATKVTAEKVS